MRDEYNAELLSARQIAEEPFDNKVAHMSAFLTTKAEEVVLGGGPELGFRKQKHVVKH